MNQDCDRPAKPSTGGQALTGSSESENSLSLSKLISAKRMISLSLVPAEKTAHGRSSNALTLVCAPWQLRLQRIISRTWDDETSITLASCATILRSRRTNPL